MRLNWALLWAMVLLSLFSVQGSMMRAQQQDAAVPTIRVTSQLVFLDVTVIGKDGRPVTSGLTRDDFSITDDKKPQRIFSFEAPESHVVDAGGPEEDRAGKAPMTIFVLDLLNSSFEDFAYIRFRMRRYLKAQPDELASPAEMMVLGNDSLEMVQDYTRSKADLLYALDHVPPSFPYKVLPDRPSLPGAFGLERFLSSIDALQQIALQNKGMPGRKNIVWVGHGGPNMFTSNLSGAVGKLMRYIHDTTNQLVESRMSLYVIYPGLQANDTGVSFSQMGAIGRIGDEDPFAGQINFGVLVQQTGGKLFYDRNDLDSEMTEALEEGTEYYTLTYQPPALTAAEADGRFRRIRVTVRDPNLRVVTKTGYFAPDKEALSPDSRQQTLVNVSEAAHATIPFSALDVSIEDLVRHPDSGTAEFTVLLRSRNIVWQPEPQGRSSFEFFLAAASLNGDRRFLTSRFESLKATGSNQDASRLARTVTRVPVTLRTPTKMKSVRIVVQTAEGRTGAVELDGKQIAAAPWAPTPEPKLISRPKMQDAPAQP